jgi:hypothetical protein
VPFLDPWYTGSDVLDLWPRRRTTMDATPTRTHTKETITLRLIGHEGLRYGRCPVTFGVPFADGASRRGAAVRLVDENGSPIPTQTQCLATWDRELEYVKRLLVDAQVDLGEGWARDLTLEYPADAPPPEPEQQVCVKEEGEYLRVDTGAMRLWIRRTFHQWQLPRRPDVFARRSFHWLLRTVPEPGQLPNSVFTRGERGDEAVVQPPCLPEVDWGNKYHV